MVVGRDQWRESAGDQILLLYLAKGVEDWKARAKARNGY
jgi:hypothetical protein